MISETLQPIDNRIGSGDEYRDILQQGANVYRASRSGKYFLLKTPADESTASLERLKREYDLARRLQHPFIVSAIAWEEETPVGPAVVFEYVQGRTLTEWLTERPALRDRERLFGQILDAVGAIHRQSIIHNDIKPENILVTETDNDAKLIDFGFADGDAHYLGKGLGGTRSYASPELLAHEKTDARSDIYSLGVLMQDLFPGRYGWIARKCRQATPDRRYRNIDALRRAWLHRHRPWLLAIPLCAAALVAAIFLLKPSRPDPILPEEVKTDTVITEAIPDTIAPVSSPKPAGSTKPSSGATVPEKAKATLKKAWDDAYTQATREMAEVPYDEFLPIHADLAAYEVDPVFRQLLKSDLPQEAIQDITAYNNVLRTEYYKRVNKQYVKLPSVYDSTLDIPDAERKYYQALVAHFERYVPYKGD